MAKLNSLDKANGDNGGIVRDSKDWEEISSKVSSALDKGLIDINDGNYEEVSEENTDKRLRAFKSRS